MNVTAAVYGGHVTYECTDRHVIVQGDHVIECLANGSWSGQSAVCECNLHHSALLS